MKKSMTKPKTHLFLTVAKNRLRQNCENRGLLFLLTAASMLFGLVGCGSSSADPTASMKDLNATVAPHKLTARDQDVAMAGAYAIEVEKGATIIEGEAQSFKVYVRMFQKVDSYELKLAQVPADVTGMSLKTVDSEPGTFQIEWTAPKGTVPAAQLDRSVEFKLEITNVKSSSPSVEQHFAGIVREVTRSIRVIRTGKRPEIVAATLPAKVAQGSVQSFTVDVVDPASYVGSAPRLDVFFQGTSKTTDGYKANAATYVRLDKVPELVNGAWRYFFVFDAKNNDVGAQLDASGKRADGATGLQARMFVKAFSAAGLPSQNEKQIDVEITFSKLQAAVIGDCPVPPTASAPGKMPAKTKPKTVAKK